MNEVFSRENTSVYYVWYKYIYKYIYVMIKFYNFYIISIVTIYIYCRIM